MLNKEIKTSHHPSSKICSFFYMTPHLYPGSARTGLCLFGGRESFTWMIIIKTKDHSLFGLGLPEFPRLVDKRCFCFCKEIRKMHFLDKMSPCSLATAHSHTKTSTIFRARNVLFMFLPKNLCHGGTQKEVEQVSELHTCKGANHVFDNSPKV